MKTIQFYTKIGTRNGFRGAQIKTWDYFNHINSHHAYKSNIAFHPDSQWNKFVYWKQNDLKNHIPIHNPYAYLLKGGNDWIEFIKRFSIDSGKPIISPIVNFRVLNKDHPSNTLLKKKAIRVCPSPELAKQLSEDEDTNGPVLCIPNGINRTGSYGNSYENRHWDLLIVAIKNKNLGLRIYEKFRGDLKVKLLNEFICHSEFRELMANSKLTLHLPKTMEAHYLPGLESMSLGSVTIMPDCVGNVFYCESNKSGFICEYSEESITYTINKVLNLQESEILKIIIDAHHKANDFCLDNERENWHKLLDNIETIWNN